MERIWWQITWENTETGNSGMDEIEAETSYDAVLLWTVTLVESIGSSRATLWRIFDVLPRDV